MTTWINGNPREDENSKRLTEQDRPAGGGCNRKIQISLFGYPAGGSFTLPVTLKTKNEEGEDEDVEADVEIGHSASPSDVEDAFEAAFPEQLEEGDVKATSLGLIIKDSPVAISIKGYPASKITFGEVVLDDLIGGLRPYVRVEQCCG